MTPLKGLSVLLAEDEVLIALDAEEMLLELGAAEVSVANSYDDALRLIGEKRFDFVLLDVSLHGQKSFPLAEALFSRDTAVVFGTGYNRISHQFADGRTAGCVGKPYTAESLRKEIAAVLAGASKSANSTSAAIRSAPL